MSLTRQQRGAVTAAGSVAVTAGAGTGKTHMLTERYLHHLTVDRLRPLEIVAGTFTEAAAAELRGRVRARLRELPHLGHLTAELEAAQIGTLHSLAGRICREHPDAAGVPWDFAVQDELQQRLWLDRTFRKALAQLPAELGSALPFDTFSAALRALLADPFTARHALAADPDSWPELIRTEQERVFLRISASADWRRALALLQNHSGPGDDKLELQRREALAAVDQFERGEFSPAACATLDNLSRRPGSAKAWGDAVIALKEACGMLRECYRSGKYAFQLTLGPADDLLRLAVAELRTAFEGIEAYLSEVKRSERLLDFNDLELHALRALEHDEVRAFYRCRWKAFLVDEFQDTNPVQAELLARLTGLRLAADGPAVEGSSPPGEDRAEALRFQAMNGEDFPPARLTVVGDEKQSIYGFRRADLTVFRSVRQAISEEGGEVVELSTSFRTHQELIAPLNQVFAPALAELHQDLSGARIAAPGRGPFLSVHLLLHEEKELKQFRQRAEAHRLGELIERFLRDEVPVHDKESGQLRPVRPGDIAILARTWDTLGPYADELAARTIPTIHAGGGNLLVQREAKDATSLLRFLADPNDDLSLAALLRSPFFAVTDRNLLELAEQAQGSSWWQVLSGLGDDPFAPQARGRQPAPGRPDTLGFAAGALARLLALRREATPARLLAIADELTGYTAVISNLPGGQRRLADWRGFCDFVRELERGQEDVFAVVRELRLLASLDDVKVPRPGMEAGDAVSLMSVHNAKGLEWPIVVIPDITAGGSGKGGGIVFEAAAGVAFKVNDEEGEALAPALFTILEERRKQREADEELRVLYVALTRARDRVVLSGSKEKGGRLQTLSAGLEAAGIEAVLTPYDPSDSVPKTPRPEVAEAYGLRLLESAGSGLFELPVTSLASYASCPKRFHFEQVLQHPGSVPPGDGTSSPSQGTSTPAGNGATDSAGAFAGSVGDRGTAPPPGGAAGGAVPAAHSGPASPAVAARLGDLTHKALQFDISDAAELARFDNTLPPAQVRQALAFATAFRQSPAFAAVRDRIARRELPLTIDGQVYGSRLRLHGVADAVAPEFVLDYKTGASGEKEAHLLQVAIYAQALGRDQAYIAYLREGRLEAYSAEELRAGREGVRTVLQGIEAGEFGATPALKKCGSCPFERICEASALRGIGREGVQTT